MEILILVVLTLLNGFFALSEISIISVRKDRMKRKAQEGSKSAQTVLDLLAEPEDFLSAVQVGITLIGVVLGAYGGAALSDDMRGVLVQVEFLAPYADTLSIIIVVGLITYFSIVIGELIPKTLAMGSSERIALLVAPIIKAFTKGTLPLVKLLSMSTNVVMKILRVKEAEEEKMSEEELRQIIKTAGKQGVLAKDETDLHQNIFQYSGQRARNLRTHRREVEWVNLQEPVEEIHRKIKASAHSKFPVYDGQQDKIMGILTAKDFYENLLTQRLPVAAIVKEPIYVPETMYASAVLTLFKEKKQYLGIVVDEFGAVEGIITLHDILEAIVGNIPDIDELEETLLVKREDGSFLVSGGLEVKELNRQLKRELIKKNPTEFETLAGFIIYYLNRIPATGEKFTYNGYELEIVDLDGSKIDKVLLKEIPVK
ncbi:hemolysin family protein [Rufibacter quisquiliarum]|uniref:Putative hemolysin n=1 Tax=Rufibacter quisquiliarum TaxID=1549639 RepID=A0A839GKM0_9BACT|nr:hemolysin family protein [Rufibacter quisquiliarum]MBA9075566.1 putative hemolysin [Rufibacter quisquiliarum]